MTNFSKIPLNKQINMSSNIEITVKKSKPMKNPDKKSNVQSKKKKDEKKPNKEDRNIRRMDDEEKSDERVPVERSNLKKKKRRHLQFEIVYTNYASDAPEKYINPLDDIIKRINDKNKTRNIIY